MTMAIPHTGMQLYRLLYYTVQWASCIYILCVHVYMTDDMTASDTDDRNGNIETLQSYPENLNLAGLLSQCITLP